MKIRSGAIGTYSGLLCLLASAFPISSTAFEFERGELTGSVKTSITVGATWSMQRKHSGLIGKLNIEGQQALCDSGQPIDILGLPGVLPDPLGSCALSGFETFYNAEGNYSGHGTDDGRLNYDQHDLVAAAAKLTTDVSLQYGNVGFNSRFIALSDPVNTGFTETHVNNFENGGAQPANTPRSKAAEDEAYNHIQLETAYFELTTEFAERTQVWRLGKQLVR